MFRGTWTGPTPSHLQALGGDAVPTITDRFETFHQTNPWVYAELVRLARELVQKGHERIGMKMLFEVIRWERMRATSSDEPFRLNNSFTSRYARLIAAQEPDLADAFAMRELRAD
jgi:hypothetical protein